jgi:hypothetical protein
MDDHVSLLSSRFHIAVSFNDLFQRILPIDQDFDLSRCNQLLYVAQFLDLLTGRAPDRGVPAAAGEGVAAI